MEQGRTRVKRPGQRENVKGGKFRSWLFWHAFVKAEAGKKKCRYMGKMTCNSTKGKACLCPRAASPMTRFQRREAPGSRGLDEGQKKLLLGLERRGGHQAHVGQHSPREDTCEGLTGPPSHLAGKTGAHWSCGLPQKREGCWEPQFTGTVPDTTTAGRFSLGLEGGRKKVPAVRLQKGLPKEAGNCVWS